MKRKGRSVDGVLLLDKPPGISSHAALQRAKRLLGAAKAGHTGTLDPLASGLLPCCFGEATKFAGYLLEADKTYLASVRLGANTTTGDSEGDIVFHGDVSTLGAGDIERVLTDLVGPMEQVPPMYSALKHAGRPLYAYAREGQTVKRAARIVRIHALDLLCSTSQQLEMRLRVSKGTYIRSLAQEIGERLGCGAHLVALRREESGDLHVARAVTLGQLEDMEESSRSRTLSPVDSLARSLPCVKVTEQAAKALRQGKGIEAPGMAACKAVRLYAPCFGFIGVGEISADGRLLPRRLLSTAGTGFSPES